VPDEAATIFALPLVPVVLAFPDVRGCPEVPVVPVIPVFLAAATVFSGVPQFPTVPDVSTLLLASMTPLVLPVVPGLPLPTVPVVLAVFPPVETFRACPPALTPGVVS